MAEWLGNLIADWPTFLIGLACGAMLIAGGILIWFWTAADPYPFGEKVNLSRKKNREELGKKKNGKK